MIETWKFQHESIALGTALRSLAAANPMMDT